MHEKIIKLIGAVLLLLLVAARPRATGADQKILVGIYPHPPLMTIDDRGRPE